MVFLKHFDTSKQTLHGIGKCYAQRNAKISDLVPTINERMRWTPGTPLKLFEEIKPGMIEHMKPKLTFSQSEIQDGDVICFQVDLSEKEYVLQTVLRGSSNIGQGSRPRDARALLKSHPVL